MSNLKASDKEMTTSISLDNNLYKAVKHLAVEENKTFKDIVTESIKAYLEGKGIKVLTD